MNQTNHLKQKLSLFRTQTLTLTDTKLKIVIKTIFKSKELEVPYIVFEDNFTRKMEFAMNSFFASLTSLLLPIGALYNFFYASKPAPDFLWGQFLIGTLLFAVFAIICKTFTGPVYYLHGTTKGYVGVNANTPSKEVVEQFKTELIARVKASKSKQDTSIQESISLNFEVDPNVAKLAEAYALDCVDFMKDRLGVTLDWSDESVYQLEPALDNLSESVRSGDVTKETAFDFAKMFGFYIGETYRKNYEGTEWGNVTMDGASYFAIGSKNKSRAVIWPVANVMKRIELGRESNIALYYRAVIGE